MTEAPARDEAASDYFRFIDLVREGDVVARLRSQLDTTAAFFSGISAEQSLFRYEPGKWSIRQILNHLSDTERLFLFRSLWFARGLDGPLPSFDQHVSLANSGADDVSWAAHLEEFRCVRLASVVFFRNLPSEAWSRSGLASGNRFTVRALAYSTAGHFEYHASIIRERSVGIAGGRARAEILSSALRPDSPASRAFASLPAPPDEPAMF